MKLLTETTFAEPCYNHTYLATDDRFFIVAYQPHGTSEMRYFTSPLKFNYKGRTFKETKVKG